VKKATFFACAVLLAALSGVLRPSFADSLAPLADGAAPQNVDALWEGYDPRKEPLQTEVVRQWREDGMVLRYVVYTIGTFRGEQARMAAFYGFPEGQTRLPAVMHLHGGGQRALLQAVKQYARRGYACLSVNWGGREMENAAPGDPNTDWGAVDPTQNNVGGYSNLLPKGNTIDAVESPRNNNWFLLTVGCRRGIVFLEQQPEVDAERIGVWGHSMGGQLTVLVAGTDRRVKVAAPSVGGSGFLQTDLWGLLGSARTVAGDLDLFQRTLAGQAYLARVRCPILFLSATNDFNAPMDFVERGMALVPHEAKRTVYAPHLNHRFTPETDVARALWFDAYLQGRLAFPKTPRAELILDGHDGVPLLHVVPDASREIDRVDIYYGYERDTRNRFWADARATRRGEAWEGECPVFDLDEPLFAFANVYYRLAAGERREGDPETFAISVARAAYPDDLRRAGVKASSQVSRAIDDFSRGLHDWYVLAGDNRHHWHFATRKLADPRWAGPRGGRLCFEVTTTAADNTLAVQIDTNAWRSYAGRDHKQYTAVVRLPEAGKHRVELRAADFAADAGQVLQDWEGITELAFRAADKARPGDKSLRPWQGDVPKFANLEWVGGEAVRRPKPFLKD